MQLLYLTRERHRRDHFCRPCGQHNAPKQFFLVASERVDVEFSSGSPLFLLTSSVCVDIEFCLGGKFCVDLEFCLEAEFRVDIDDFCVGVEFTT